MIHAASGTWEGLGSNNLWATTSNWSPATIPAGGDTAIFNGLGNGKTTVEMKDGGNNPVTIGNIVFDSASAATYTFVNNSPQSRFFANAGGSSITVNSGVVNPQNFNVRITMNGSLSLTNDSVSSAAILNFAGSSIDQGGGDGLRTLTLGGSNAGANTISNVLDDDGAGGTRFLRVVKTGTGTWRLTGANTYVNDTTVNQGLLLVNNTSGSGTGTGAVAVNSGGTLGGGDNTLTRGRVSGSVTVADDGAIAPGTPEVNNGIGRLSLGTTSFASGGSVLDWNVGSALGNGSSSPGVTWDHLNIAGDLNIGSTAMFTINIDGNVTGYTSGTPVSYTIATFTGSQTGVPFDADAFTLNTDNFTPDAGFAADNWSIGLNGNNVVLTYTPVPEPGAAGMLVLASATLLTLRRRRQ